MQKEQKRFWRPQISYALKRPAMIVKLLYGEPIPKILSEIVRRGLLKELENARNLRHSILIKEELDLWIRKLRGHEHD